MKKIRNIENVCNSEQIAAYNFCFRFYEVYLSQKEDKNAIIEALLQPLKHYKKLDFNAVSWYVHRNIERYATGKKRFFSYKEIGSFFK